METIQKNDSMEEKIRKIMEAVGELQKRIFEIERIIEDIPHIEAILIDTQEKLKEKK